MSKIITVGLNLTKNAFQVHGADSAGGSVLRKKLRRAQVLEFFGQLPPCVVAMEACGGAHFWGREIGKLGHEERLTPMRHGTRQPYEKRSRHGVHRLQLAWFCSAAMADSCTAVNIDR